MTVRTTSPTSILVELLGVSKTYRRGPEQVHALRTVDLAIRSGEVTVVLGPSGSGKSTLLSVLSGWEEPEEGEVRWPDRPTGSSFARPWSEMALVPQSLGLLEELSVRENIELPLRLSEAGGDGAHSRRVDALLSHLGLAALAHRRPAEASVGEQQRTALARALAIRPTLILADEPTGHQDEAWTKVVFATIRAVAGAGTACVMATHNREALRHADRVVEIRDGVVRGGA